MFKKVEQSCLLFKLGTKAILLLCSVLSVSWLMIGIKQLHRICDYLNLAW